ncbi:BspA family leucine-rich repeat surface protein [Lactobacillus sp. B4026]|uniref:BspA family leucine-rich repeat surface protein n=1 Tax=Lactobacillus sp. B4026 TaxID=2818035 RepID=UPI00226B48F8|nr:BspA family leucine-rich repeat surface protein [Lactobacillus sp. B4026]MCX8736025.1 BspA family leucine-rich repeat surface protein [Lactobacillus sp. B4026]
MKKEKNTKAFITTTVVGLVCGLALTQQQAKAATIDPADNQSNTAIVQAPKTDQGVIPAETDSQANTDTEDDSAEKATENKPKDNAGKDVAPDKSEAANKQTVTAKAAIDPEIIDQGTWGTSKWEYKHEGDDYVLYLHEGTLGKTNISQLNGTFEVQLTKIKIDRGVVANQDSQGLFMDLSKLTTIDGLENLDTSKATSMDSMFDGCSNLRNLDLSNFNTSKVTSMGAMFQKCSNLKTLGLSHFDTSHVTNMGWMFYECNNLKTLDVNHFDTSHVVDMAAMFSGCSKLETLDVSHFDTSKVACMPTMFDGCVNLKALDLSNFDTSHVTDINYMFNLCNKLNHLVLGAKAKLTSDVKLPAVPAVNTVVSGSNRIVTAPYWVATSGYAQGKRYTSDELMSLTGRDQVTTYDWVTQTVAADTTQTKAVTRLIVIHQPDGSTKTDAQTVMITRPVIIKPNGSISWGSWTTAQWTAHEVPAFAGYNPSVKEIPAQTVTSQTGDQAIDIYYDPIEQTITVQYVDASGKVVGTQEITGYTGDTLTPNYHAPAGYELAAAPQPSIKVDGSGKQVIKVSVNPKSVQNTELKTITRTINVHQPDGSIKTYNQVAVIRRTVSLDQITGEKTYGSWHNDSWDEFKVPAITGYTPSQTTVTGQEVTADSENEQVEIYYFANK